LLTISEVSIQVDIHQLHFFYISWRNIHDRTRRKEPLQLCNGSRINGWRKLDHKLNNKLSLFKGILIAWHPLSHDTLNGSMLDYFSRNASDNKFSLVHRFNDLLEAAKSFC